MLQSIIKAVEHIKRMNIVQFSKHKHIYVTFKCLNCTKKTERNEIWNINLSLPYNL